LNDKLICNAQKKSDLININFCSKLTRNQKRKFFISDKFEQIQTRRFGVIGEKIKENKEDNVLMKAKIKRK